MKRAFGIAVASLWVEVEVSDCGCWLLAQRTSRCAAAVGCGVIAEHFALAFRALRGVCVVQGPIAECWLVSYNASQPIFVALLSRLGAPASLGGSEDAHNRRLRPVHGSYRAAFTIYSKRLISVL